MQLLSLTFLYLFLPSALLICWITPIRYRAAVLLAVSVSYYALAQGFFALAGAVVIICDLLLANLIRGSVGNPALKKGAAIFSALKSAAVIVGFEAFAANTGTSVPLGTAVICLTSTGYVFDLCYGWAPKSAGTVHTALMISFFPKLYAGPLVTYSRMAPSLCAPRMSMSRVGSGGWLLIRGTSKLLLLGNPLWSLFTTLHEAPLYDTSVLTVWMTVMTLALSLYYRLSGYCDMARGIGIMLGLELPENFRTPFAARSVNDFFSRFNITVSRFWRRYLYLKLGGAHGNLLSVSVNIMLSCIMMGLWYGLKLNFALWGAFLALFVIAERFVPKKVHQSVPPLLSWGYCMTVLLVSFAFFAGETPSASFDMLRIMMGLGGAPAASKEALYQIASHHLLLILSVVLATSLPLIIAEATRKHFPKTFIVLRTVFTAALMLVCTMLLL